MEAPKPPHPKDADLFDHIEQAQKPVGIDKALEDAVLHGRMTTEEAADCMAAYIRTFTNESEVL